MSALKELPIVVVDVETSGHDPLQNRITEIACIVVQNGQIIREFSSLMNPEQAIPPFIQNMNGITQKMAEQAPKAPQVMQEVYDILNVPGVIFAAHNAAFDWGFVKASLIRCGFSVPEISQLCTYSLAKRLLPADMKKNVGALAEYYGIPLAERHRAYDDAFATAGFLLRFLDILEKDYGVSTTADMLLFEKRRSLRTRFSDPVREDNKREDNRKLRNAAGNIPAIAARSLTKALPDIALDQAPIIVVDVETTGHDPILNRITEIACVVISQGRIQETFTSLINPGQAIPPFIQKMNGLTQELADRAPMPYQVMPEIHRLLSLPNAIFAAHNVHFDWGFVSQTLQSCGLSVPDIPLLCTYKLARRLMPGDIKKNVGAVAAAFGIDFGNNEYGRHRALGDAEATAAFLLRFIEMLNREHGINTVQQALQFQKKRSGKSAQPATAQNNAGTEPDTVPVFASDEKKSGETSLFWDIPIIVVDVEKTGRDPSQNRIMEIGCAVIQNGEIVEEYHSLINPHQFIRPQIEDVVGISNIMAYNAPQADEIMPRVHQLLSMPRAVFAAHDVGSDWAFVSHTLQRCGLSVPDIPLLCTDKLARRLMPRHLKTNVGAIAQHFGIIIEDRHRAMDDARATARFLLRFLDMLEQEHDVETVEELLQFQNKRLQQFHPPQAAIRRVQPYLQQLPAEPGIYKMLDKNKEILYVGKAKSLRDRVRSYFQPGADLTPKIAKMVKNVYSIQWECTNTELAALLLESREIKRIKPPFNTASKKIRRFPFLRLSTEDAFPRLEWSSTIAMDGAEYFGPFRSRALAHEIAETVNKGFLLRKCTDPLQPAADIQPCFYHQIKRCGAPCALLQSHQDYAREVQRVRAFLSGSSGGLLEQLEAEMHAEAESLRFESAAALRNRLTELKRLFERRSPGNASVTHNNTILVLPAGDKTSEVFCIRGGRLAHQEIIGRKAALEKLDDLIRTLYFGPTAGPGGDTVSTLSPMEVDEIQIITSWIHRFGPMAEIIYTDNLQPEDLLQRLRAAIRRTPADEEKTRSEYSQLPENS
jgi:DNA polymerase-3 subunit epsilon